MSRIITQRRDGIRSNRQRKKMVGGNRIGSLPPLPFYHGGCQKSSAKTGKNRMVKPFPPAPAPDTHRYAPRLRLGLRPAFGPGAPLLRRFALWSAAPRLRAGLRPPFGPGSALRDRRALHRGGPSREGCAPRSPVRSPRTRFRSASASAVCAAAAGRRAAQPPGSALRFARASALALAGDRAAPSPRGGSAPSLALLRIRPFGPGSRRARRPGQAAPPPV